MPSPERLPEEAPAIAEGLVLLSADQLVKSATQSEWWRHPDPKASAEGIDERVTVALKALENANQGENAERTGISAQTLFRMYHK